VHKFTAQFHQIILTINMGPTFLFLYLKSTLDKVALTIESRPTLATEPHQQPASRDDREGAPS